MPNTCSRSLEQLDAGLLSTMEQNIVSCVEGGNNVQMKEIRGLGDRLSGLEQLLLDAKKKVTEQQDLAQAFLQNQARASGLRDTSILPDLCATHRQQLLGEIGVDIIVEFYDLFLLSDDEKPSTYSVNKKKMCQGQGRVKCQSSYEAKMGDVHSGEMFYELLYKLIMLFLLQRQMADHGHQLVLYHEELRRLSRRLEVMEQLHLAPSIYLATVVEVVRRRSFR